MFPKIHILIGLIVSGILIYLFNLPVIAGVIIFLSSFLIDVDHYLYYIIVKKDLSLKNAYDFFVETRNIRGSFSRAKRKKYKRELIIFHGLEFGIVLVVLSFFNMFFLWILIGFGIHMIADFIDIVKYQDDLLAKVSQIYVYIKNKNKKNLN